LPHPGIAFEPKAGSYLQVCQKQYLRKADLSINNLSINIDRFSLAELEHLFYNHCVTTYPCHENRFSSFTVDYHFTVRKNLNIPKKELFLIVLLTPFISLQGGPGGV